MDGGSTGTASIPLKVLTYCGKQSFGLSPGFPDWRKPIYCCSLLKRIVPRSLPDWETISGTFRKSCCRGQGTDCACAGVPCC